jgi:energy-coupling factor transporter ATP-binding protein EcfA2
VIESLGIHGYRGIQDAQVDGLTPLVVLVGPNGSGKSTVLESLLIGASNSVGEALGTCVARRSVWNGLRWLVSRSSTAGDDCHIALSASGRQRRITLLPTPGRIQANVHVAGTRNASFTTTTGIDESNLFTLQNDASLGLPFSGVVSDARLIEPRPDVTQPPLHRVYSAAVQNGRRREAEAFVKEVLPRFVNLEILTAPNSDTPEVNVVFENGALPLGLVGDGVQALVRQALELAALKDGLALLEEPEAFKHPAAIRQTARAIVAAAGRDVQVVLSTHSLELIDAIVEASSTDEALARLSLYRLALQDGKLSTSRLAGAQVKQLRSQIEEDLR